MKTLIGAMVGAVVLASTIAMVAYSQDRKPDSSIRPFAAGSIVSIVMPDSGNAGIYLEEPELKKIGETWFIVGKYAALPGFPSVSETLTGWVAVSSITTINEYKNADELRKAFPIQTQTGS